MTVNFDPELSIQDNWKKALPLNDAWYLCAPLDLKSQYQNAGSNDALSGSLVVMMQKELHYNLTNGYLQAIGIQIAPDHSTTPMIISETLFASDTAVIDFEQSKLDSLNFEYMDVRVCKINNDDMQIGNIGAKAPTKMGRKSITPLLNEAIDILQNDDPDFEDKTQEKKIIAIQGKVSELHPGQYPNDATPGKTTVRLYLKDLFG